MIRVHTLNIDLTLPKIVPTIQFNQADVNTNVFQFVITNNNTAYDFTNRTLKLFVRKSNRVTVQKTITDVVDNTATLVLEQGLTNLKGSHIAELHMLEGDKTLSVCQFRYYVSETVSDLYADVPSTQLTVLQDLSNRVTKLENSGGSGTSDWNGITNKPSTFPPSSHTHNEYAPTSHTHDYTTLTNTPTIPTVDVTKNYVDTELSKKQNSNVVTKRKKPLVSFLFDDARINDKNIVLNQILIPENVKANGCMIVNRIEEAQFSFMTIEEIKANEATGLMRYYSHSARHLTLEQLDALGAGAREFEVTHSKQFMQENGFTHNDIYVFPYGQFDKEYVELVEKNYKAGINIHSNNVSDIKGSGANSDYYIYRRLGIGENNDNNTIVTVAQCKADVDYALANNCWLIFMGHPNYANWLDTSPGTAGNSAARVAEFRELIQYIKSLNIDIVFLDEGFEEYKNISEINDFDGNYTITDAKGQTFTSKKEVDTLKTPVTNLAYKNNWVDRYVEKGVYWQQADGTVHIQASVKRNSGTSGVFADIPANITPKRPLRFPCAFYNGTKWVSDGVIMVDQSGKTLTFLEGTNTVASSSIVSFYIVYNPMFV